MLESPRPYHERFVESYNLKQGNIVSLCKCGNTFQKLEHSKQIYCSRVCIRRYFNTKSEQFADLADMLRYGGEAS